ncbi:hypothetical protein JB92DRAFT_3129157 [Gautieria morchelliformis]|nr:hypothetical protein JB92DRAFT_3129157 [Gautieria morchelliformis]
MAGTKHPQSAPHDIADIQLLFWSVNSSPTEYNTGSMTAPGIVPASIPSGAIYSTPGPSLDSYVTENGEFEAFDAHQREAIGSSNTSSFPIPQFRVDPQEVFPSLHAAYSQFPINASPPHDHQVHTGMGYPEFSYPAFDTSTRWQQQTSTILPGPYTDVGMPLGYNVPSHPLEQPQNCWSHSTQQSIAYASQSQQTYIAPAGQLRVHIPTRPVTFNDSATVQMTLSVNSAEFYDQWTIQPNSYFPQLEESSNAFPPIDSIFNPWFVRSQGSNPSYRLNNRSHDDGHVWNATHVPPPATIALEQLEGSSRLMSHPGHATVPEAPSSSRSHTHHRTHATSPIIDLILSSEGICTTACRTALVYLPCYERAADDRQEEPGYVAGYDYQHPGQDAHSEDVHCVLPVQLLPQAVQALSETGQPLPAHENLCQERKQEAYKGSQDTATGQQGSSPYATAGKPSGLFRESI